MRLFWIFPLTLHIAEDHAVALQLTSFWSHAASVTWPTTGPSISLTWYESLLQASNFLIHRLWPVKFPFPFASALQIVLINYRAFSDLTKRVWLSYLVFAVPTTMNRLQNNLMGFQFYRVLAVTLFFSVQCSNFACLSNFVKIKFRRRGVWRQSAYRNHSKALLYL